MGLVLSRRKDERILIGADISVRVVRIGPNTVRLAIEAPRDVNIAREEVAYLDSVEEVSRRHARESIPVETLETANLA